MYEIFRYNLSLNSILLEKVKRKVSPNTLIYYAIAGSEIFILIFKSQELVLNL